MAVGDSDHQVLYDIDRPSAMDPPDGRIDVAAALVPFVPFVLLPVRRWRCCGPSSSSFSPSICRPLSGPGPPFFLVLRWSRRLVSGGGVHGSSLLDADAQEEFRMLKMKKERGEEGGVGRPRGLRERRAAKDRRGVEFPADYVGRIYEAGRTSKACSACWILLHLTKTAGMCQFTYHFLDRRRCWTRGRSPAYPPCVRRSSWSIEGEN